MTEPLFPNLREQREGPITVGPHTLLPCPSCDGEGIMAGWPFDPGVAQHCTACNGGGQVLVRLC